MVRATMKFAGKTIRPVIASFFIALLLAPVSVAALNPSDTQSINNDTVWYNPSGGSICGGGGAIALTGSDNVQKAFNFFLGKGLSDAQASGVIGNLEQESGQGLNPLPHQDGTKGTPPIPNV